MALLQPEWPLTFNPTGLVTLQNTDWGSGTVITTTDVPLQLLKFYMAMNNTDIAVTVVGPSGANRAGGPFALKFRGLVKTNHPVSNMYDFFNRATAGVTRLYMDEHTFYVVVDSIRLRDRDGGDSLYYIHFGRQNGAWSGSFTP